MKKYTDKVVICYDSDEAGQKAADKAMRLLSEVDIAVRVLRIPGAKDPDEYIKKYGVDRMRSLLDGCESDIDYTIGRIRSKYNLASDDGRLQFLREVCPALSELSAIEREVYAGRIAADLGIDKGAILSQIDSGRKRRQNTTVPW